MSYDNIKILNEDAKSLKDNEWHEIENLIKKFPSNVNIKHSVRYLKNKLLESPYGSSYVTRAINADESCVGFLSLTRKSITCVKENFVSFELGDAYLDREFHGRFIFLME